MEKGIFDLSGFESKSTNDPIAKANSITESAEMTLTAQQYKSIMGQLQKSFNEGVAIMEKLSNATVIDKDPATAQAEYTEECLAEAYLQSIEDGPIFEAVDRSDKEEIKAITRSIRAKVKKICRDNNLKFYQTSLLVRSGYKDGDPLLGALMGTADTPNGNLPISVSASMKSIKTKNINWFTTRLFQLVGMVLIDPEDVNDFVKTLNEQLVDKLEGYNIVSAIALPSLLDLFRTKFNWKNMDELRPYMLLVDRAKKSVNKTIKESTDSEEYIDILNTTIDETAEFQGVDSEYNPNKEGLDDTTWNKQKDAFKKSFKEAVIGALDEI